MNLKDLIKKVQSAIGVTPDGDWGPVSTAKSDDYDITVTAKKKADEPIKPLPPGGTPWLDEAKKHKGKTEFDSTFNKYLSGFWKLVGLPGYKTIIGTSFAWCGLFVAAMLYEVDMPFQKDGAGARNWAKYGQEIEWKSDGIPKGAIIHINGDGNCKSGSGNHVTFADGDCAPGEPSVPGFGGNQGNTAKRSMYSAKNVCAVRWPPGIALPGKVTKSVNCSGSSSGESTR